MSFDISKENGELINADGTVGVYVVDPMSPAIEPKGWEYEAVVTPKDGTAYTVTFDGTNPTVDLVEQLYVEPAVVKPGTPIVTIAPPVLANDGDVLILSGTSFVGVPQSVFRGADGIDGVDGTNGTDGLRGPKGDPGPPGAVPTPQDYFLVGPGRPDVASTTAGVITGKEPEGCMYQSTDGHNTGAYLWMRTGGRWAVVNGDTGLRDITNRWTLTPELPRSLTIRIRRVNNIVSIWFFGLPPGVHGPMMRPIEGFLNGGDLNAVGVPCVSDSGDKLIGKIQIASGWELKMSGNEPAYSWVTYITSDPWPLTLP